MAKKTGVPLLAATLMAVVGACGSDTNGAPAGSLQGTWKITTTRGTTNCSVAPGTVRYGLAVITQAAGSSVFTVTTVNQVTGVLTANGSISGGVISLSLPLGSSFSSPCTVGLNANVALTLDAGGSTGSGTSTWTCTYALGSCTGSDTVTANRI